MGIINNVQLRNDFWGDQLLLLINIDLIMFGVDKSNAVY